MNRRPFELNFLFRQLSDRSGNRTEVLDELPIVTGGAEETSNVTDILRCWPFGNGLNLVLHHTNTVTTDVMTKEFDLSLEELALTLLRI